MIITQSSLRNAEKEVTLPLTPGIYLSYLLFLMLYQSVKTHQNLSGAALLTDRNENASL